jgi:lysophospholipase L1-like esterase
MSGLPYTEYAHEDEPFAEELFDEQVSIAQRDDDELVFVAGEEDGTYTHVRDLSRRSYVPEDPPMLDVWFFGGSTLFGIGQRDEHTIPSEIARLAEADGVPIRVQNFGFPSYETWQEVGLFRRMLAQRPAPDLVVFYHGANDYAGVCRRLALGIDPYDKGSALFDKNPPEPKVRCDADPDATGALTAAVTGQRMAAARELGGSTPIVEFWQPFASTRRPTPNDRPLIDRIHSRRTDMVAATTTYRRTLDHLDRPVVDVTDAMDGTDEPVYFDYAHTNELGARLVSEAMWERSLREELRRLASGAS